MNVFELRQRLVTDYGAYVRSFIQIRDSRIQALVDREFEAGLLWPDPLIQLNPSFEPGEWIDELVEQGHLHSECRRIFRIKPEPHSSGKPLRLHRHQAEAVKTARTGQSYVLTTGTGSGKSLAYIVPIVDHVLRNGSGRGIQAIVVYPMNALANSQAGELGKFLRHGYPDGRGPVRFARYTGQESDEQKLEIIGNPPDILLTNYVMLELLLTRPHERNLVARAKGLRFLVLDELHTYRGRQGADVAMLVRRCREAFEAERLQCVGTSATLAGTGSFEEQRAEVAAVATRLFGMPVAPEHVIGETLRRATPDRRLDDPAFVAELRERLADPTRTPPLDYAGFIADPLSSWIETTFGLAVEPGSGRWVRTKPRCLTGADGAAVDLARRTGVPEERCARAIETQLLASYRCEPNPETGFPAFAFRLHQFISRGDAVYASVEAEDTRHLTVHGQQFVPGDRARVLLPLVFCRECGQEYYCVRRAQDPELGRKVFLPRELSDRAREDDTTPGFLYVNTKEPWPVDPAAVAERLPDDWVEETRGGVRVRRDRRPNLPAPVRVGPDASEQGEGTECHFFPAPFRFCLYCGVTHGFRQTSDFAKLASLATEGRSTATTILSLAVVRYLRADSDLRPEARKLLSFTDNRQDASLQAGHFNDFVGVGLLRSALCKAVAAAGAAGLRHDELALRVFDALALPIALYARDPEVRFAALEETKRALRSVLAYRLYRDLERGWRITSPNLEQCGLLQIDYESLEDLCRAADVWQGLHPALATASPEVREQVARTLLDLLRRDLAIHVDVLEPAHEDRLRQQSSQYLTAPWALEEEEALVHATVALPRSRAAGDYRGHVYLSPRGGFGQYLRRTTTFPNLGERLTLEDTQRICEQLLDALRVAGLVERVMEARGQGDVPGYQLRASALVWRAGDGSVPFHDPIRVPRLPGGGGRANPFFIDYYRKIAAEGQGLEAREHTAQVPSQVREEREARFRKAALPILYCSPTMELGVDIADLNAVNLRNVPPTPANYAQRSGRAGRSGQPALVFSYCSTFRSHDQYFFRRPERMVGGAVTPPRIDLANEDLIRAHVQAIWLAETGLALGRSLADVLDLAGDEPTLALLPHVRDDVHDSAPRERARERARRVLETVRSELERSDWYGPGWLDQVLDRVAVAFDDACERWRGLYRAALRQRAFQHRIVVDASRSADDRQKAKRLRAEAEEQIRLLSEAENVLDSDFYSYRYFASEGFLPGYNFPRLPLSAYIPGRRARRDRDEFLSRPRFIAITEFGPRAILYHEGARYRVNQVILPIDEASQGEGLTTTAAKQCGACGYLHPGCDGGGPDLCERCGEALGSPLAPLFRLQNVSARRTDRISSDEEERMRLGYEIKSGFRFTERDGRPSYRHATVAGAEGALASLTYGHAATLWRVNLGWRRRANRAQLGFVLDVERGYWASNQEDPDDPEDPMSPRTRRVIPYVEDRRNCLLFAPAAPLGRAEMASLQAALKNAIQVEYQLEEQELVAEPLPSLGDRRLVLFYEAAEGGAGVLRRLLDDAEALPRVARRALEICHFNPETGADVARAPNAREDCEAACYDCLMSYTNQIDHRLLDRWKLRDALLALARAKVSVSPAPLPRAEHLAKLLNLCGSELERDWLRLLEARDLRLPTHAQPLIEACGTRPDFLYADHHAAIYVDGAPHAYAERRERDQAQTECMEDHGYLVLRFAAGENWGALFDSHASIFGISDAAPAGGSAAGAPKQPAARFDPTFFAPEWRALLSALSSSDGIAVLPGGDVLADGRVVGSYAAEVKANEKALRLVDARTRDAVATVAALEASGFAALLLDPTDARAGEALRAELGGTA